MALETVMDAGFAKDDLRAEMVRLWAPFEWHQGHGIVRRFGDLAVGLDATDTFELDEASMEYVRDRPGALVRKLPSRLTLVMLAGEEATHPGFLRALRNALMDSGFALSKGNDESRDTEGQLLVMEGEVDPTFASARGTA